MRGGKKVKAKPKKTRAKRRKAAQPRPQIVYAQAPAPAPHPQYVYAQAPAPMDPMQPMQPKQGAFTWGDAAKLLAVEVGAQAIGHEVTEALEDDD